MTQPFAQLPPHRLGDDNLVYQPSRSPSPPGSPAHGVAVIETPVSSTTPMARRQLPAIRRPAWLTLNWFDGASSPQAQTSLRAPFAQTARTPEKDARALQHEAHRDICAMHFSRAVASHALIGDITMAVESALSKAFGRNVPAEFADVLSSIKGDLGQSRLVLDNGSPHDPQEIDERGPGVPIWREDLLHADLVAQRAERLAIDCSQRLFQLVEGVARGDPLPEAGPEQRVDRERINRALAVIATSAFRHRLIDTLPTEQHVLRRLQLAGEALLHAPERAAEWLIPNLRNEQPMLHAQLVAEIVPMAQTAATIHRYAGAILQDIKVCLANEQMRNPSAKSGRLVSPQSAVTKQVTTLWDQAETCHAEIVNGVRETTRLASRGPRIWLSVAHAQRDIAAASVQRNRVIAADSALRNLLRKARDLPYSGSNESDSGSDSD